MSYQPPARTLDTRRSLILDIYDIAHYVEQILGQALKPPAEGVYLVGQMEPAMVPGREYWFEQPTLVEAPPVTMVKKKINMDMVEDRAGRLVLDQPLLYQAPEPQPWSYYQYNYTPVANLAQVQGSPWDVVSCNPHFSNQVKQVIVPHHLANTVMYTPDIPVIGLKIVKAVLQMDIDNSRAYRADPAPLRIEKIIHPFIDERWLPPPPSWNKRHGGNTDLEYMNNDAWFVNSLNMVFDALLPFMTPIREVMRHNPYQIATVDFTDTYQLMLNQGGDYRVHEYNTLMADPQYRIWQQARANGDWDRYITNQEERASEASATATTTNPYV